jgi:hypothetical protein
MFKITVVASKLREEMAHYLGLVKGSDVIQVLHRGDSIKVIMTQQHYLDILSRLAVYEKSIAAEVPHQSRSVIKSKLEARLKQAEQDGEASDGERIVGRTRTKSA